MQSLAGSLVMIEKEHLPLISRAVELNAIIRQQQASAFRFLASSDSREKKEALAAFQNGERRFRALYREFLILETSEAEKTGLEELGARYNIFIFTADNLFRQEELQRDPAVASQLRANFQAVAGDMIATGESFYATAQQKVSQMVVAGREQARRTVIISVLLYALALSAGLAMAFFIIRSINSPVVRLLQVTEKVAQGDLTLRADAGRTDELGRLAGAFNTMVDRLNELIREMTRQADLQVKIGRESAAGQAVRVHSVQENAGQVMAATEEVAATVHAIASRAQESSSSIAVEGEKAWASVQLLQELTARLEEVFQFTASMVRGLAEIQPVAGVIQDFAERTNILALNAGIEAARAGERGRGFAVIAEEVRKLAQASAASAREIAGRLQGVFRESVLLKQTIEQGKTAIAETRTNIQMLSSFLETLIPSFSSIVEEVNHISVAIQQVTAAMQQINQEMSVVNEFSAASARELDASARSLQSAVSRFKVMEG
ncbi:MAG: methyl-accepting chemotaxis protein [Moorella sp. (in: Bacteria)]|nr:methyl-accepting chemotaxis protein [Moorella sp. (in: firmicutes)]